jgi:hypothetical protein
MIARALESKELVPSLSSHRMLQRFTRPCVTDEKHETIRQNRRRALHPSEMVNQSLYQSRSGGRKVESVGSKFLIVPFK